MDAFEKSVEDIPSTNKLAEELERIDVDVLFSAAEVVTGKFAEIKKSPENALRDGMPVAKMAVDRTGLPEVKFVKNAPLVLIPEAQLLCLKPKPPIANSQKFFAFINTTQ